VDAATRTANRQKLARIRARVLAEVPGCAVSADQPFREADLAIDFCEDVPALPATDVQRIVDIFESEGAVAKVSSIHVNGWFGGYDKLSTSRQFAADRLGIKLDTARDRVVFCGDSPNDSPMFAYFPYACGVANVADFAAHMEARPGFVANARGGAGFVEIAEMLLAGRH
jgi:hydroxymethylpyrimidine pyrophosphatase-like HAD family hydrolase